MKAETYGATWIDMDLPFPCELHPLFPRSFNNPEAKKVLVVFSEPKQGMVDNQWIRENYKQFDLIVTYDRSLTDLPNVRILDPGGCHCNLMPSLKSATASFVLSTGINAPNYEGYQLRRDVVTKFVKSCLPFRVFLSSQRVALSQEEKDLLQDHVSSNRLSVFMLGDSKAPAFESMFHVAIENSRHDYYFTEKLLDCFRTFTIPIYRGTEAVLEIFDRRGIVFARDLQDIHEALASLSAKDYWNRLEPMAKNHEIAGRYQDQTSALKALLLREFEWSR
ncbi:MAG: glycosyltransferase family 10 [Alphaproteobacteria bacterium]|nr:glycosyltransferase family 10 [Alphaproteobacteria bacterium]